MGGAFGILLRSGTQNVIIEVAIGGTSWQHSLALAFHGETPNNNVPPWFQFTNALVKDLPETR